MSTQSMLRELPRLVPWTSWDEWRQVSGLLWSSNPSDQDLGLKRVAAWKARGKIPVSIELTVNLLEVIRKDETVSARVVRKLSGGYSSQEMRSELERRMLYSMALTRMVNGLVAPYQQSYRAKSILGICQMIGLPEDLVELRHEAAHAEIPTLAKLRSVSLECMRWLYERYWLCQTVHFDNVKAMTIERCEKLAKLQKVLSSDDAAQRPEFHSNKAESKSLIQQLIVGLTSNQVLICLVPVLASLLVPHKLQVSHLTRKYKEVPRRLLAMWMDILTKFTKRWPCFLTSLLVTLITNLFDATQLLPEFNPALPPAKDEEAKKTTRFQISLLRCWYEHLLKTFFEPSLLPAQVDAATQPDPRPSDDSPTPPKPTKPAPATQKKKDASQNTVFKCSSSLVPYKAILHLCLHHMNKHSVKIIKITLCYMSDGPEREAILPKLRTLFHFRSRALNLSRAEQALIHGGSMEKSLELERRVDVAAEEFKPVESTELSLEEFEKLIAQRITPVPTPPPTAVSPAFFQQVSASLSPSPSVQANATSEPTPSLITEHNSTEAWESNESHPRSSVWTLAAGYYPGIGLSLDGTPPGDLSLPSHLDEYVGAVFYVPSRIVPLDTSLSLGYSNSTAQHADAEQALDPNAPEKPTSGMDVEESDSEDEQDSNDRALKEPDPKRRCVETQNLEQAGGSPSSSRPVSTEPIVKVGVEKAKVKLMIAPKKSSVRK